LITRNFYAATTKYGLIRIDAIKADKSSTF
jgi:hypothetical protein